MKATCEDVAELGLEIVAKRQEIRQMQEQWAREVDDLQEDLGSCRAHSEWLERSRDEMERGLIRAQEDAARLEVRLEAARKELRDEVERRKKSYQELERHVLLWLKPGDELELCVACVGLAGDIACELPAGHRVRVVSEPGLSYQVKCEGEDPAGRLDFPAVIVKEPLHVVRLVSKPGEYTVESVEVAAARLREVTSQITALIDMGAGVHGPAAVMREQAQAIRDAAQAGLEELLRGRRAG